MKPALIKTEEQYERALAHIDVLMSAETGSAELDELELWVRLVEDYESARYPIDPPDPIAAIRFRMDQQGLRPADLIPYLGSKSRVSEVLSGKRHLTLTMIRKLHEGLGIPAEILMMQPGRSLAPALDGVDWQSFPLKEIAKRGWFGDTVTTTRDLEERAEELLGGLIHAFESACPAAVALRQSALANAGPGSPALRAWMARIWELAAEVPADRFVSAAIDESFIAHVARVSRLENGPIVARDLLAEAGIRLVVEPQLPGTRLDGAALLCTPHTAVIGLTLRYDRLDHFWFTICHELAHFALHLTGEHSEVIVDDLEAQVTGGREEEAERFAAAAMISETDWSQFFAQPRITRAELTDFARMQRLHPAIVAGRFRRETGDYKRFFPLLGNRQVRRLFLDQHQLSRSA